MMQKKPSHLIVMLVVASVAATIYVMPSIAAPSETNKATLESTPVRIDLPKFWAIIARTIGSESNSADQSKALRRELEKLPATDVASFEMTFDAVMRKSYSWDLWGADYVVHGGASDDSFEYFRVWLISKGQRVFDIVSYNPDSLADLVAPDSRGPLEFEDFAYVAREVWASKTGRSVDGMPVVANMMYPNLKPTGEPFQENESYLSTRYPKLWKRFGHNPAG